MAIENYKNYLDLGKPIALGRTAEVYNWNDKQVVKLYYPNWDRGNVEYEFKISNLVCDLGLQVPEVGEIIEINGRNGIIYEKLHGKSMLQFMKTKPLKINTFGHQLAELQYSFHQKIVTNLPKLVDNMEKGIERRNYLTEEEKTRIVKKLKTLPESNQLCHYDFHPDNVIITDNGPYIIDWMTVSQGNPIGDFARSALLLQIGTPPSGFIDKALTGIFRSWFYRGYSKRYFELSDIDKEDLKDWELPIAAHRLHSDNIEEERGQLLTMIRSKLQEETI